jgi:hypothetical protein
MDHIFVSYSRTDQAFVDKLRTDLESYGADVWIDVEDIRSGENWADAIQRALDTCMVMVLVISPDSVASDQVKHEWQYYQDLKKPIIPVIYRPAKVQFQLSRVQYIDFSRQQYLPALGQLCVELQARGVQLTGRIPQPPKPASSAKRGGRISCLAKSLLGAVALVAVVGVVVFALLTLGSQSEEKPPSTGDTQHPAENIPPENPDNSPGGPEQIPGSDQANVEYHENDDPVDVVRFFFEALGAGNDVLIGELLCPEHESFRAEYADRLRNLTITVRNLTIGQLENATMRSVRVHFIFTLAVKNPNGDVKEVTDEPFFFDIRRRDPDMPDSPWCNDSPELPMFW